MTAATSTIITEPGIHPDLPEAAYHADPVPGGSLSSGGARTLLKPGGPARFAYELRNPPASKPEFEFGKAAHTVILGSGAELTVVDAPSWRAKLVQEFREREISEGRLPILEHEYLQVKAMEAAIRADDLAGPILDPDSGEAETSGFWVDTRTGMWCRFRADKIRRRAGRRTVIADYKTCRSAAPDDLRRDVWNYGYYIQGAWYRNGARALGIDDDPLFVFVAQEKTPPYLVHTFVLDQPLQRAGEGACRRALDTYAKCRAADTWPGYQTDDITTITAPGWAPIGELA